MDNQLSQPSGSNPPDSEPKPQELSSLTPPSFLSADANALWQMTVADYSAMGLLKSVDVIKFSHYLFAVAQANALAKEIAEKGGIINQPNKKGFTTASHHPRVQQYMDFIRLADKLGIQFGDSPAARARLGRLLEDQDNDLESALGEKPEK